MAPILDKRSDPNAAPAIDIACHDVDAVNRRDQRVRYARRQKIYPKEAHGTFRTTKWAVMAVTLGIYYAIPWLRWNRGPDLPDQAVLLDMANNRYFVFFLEIWPQEFYFVTGLLVLATLALFLSTSIAGRVWCGYTCPQTVWTDLMIAVERFWQGDRNARIRLDREPWGVSKILRKTMTHLTWLAVGVLTGGAFVFYFRDAPTLARELATGTAPAVAYIFLGLFTATTYVLGGIAREQVCIYMCPWPRIQGAMTDSHTLLVSYKPERGEPRGAMRKGRDGLVDWSERGDCIDCKACIAVCPTGIDIRDGSQLECIQCALCIDACNDIMARIGRPRGLIAYDTVARQRSRAGAIHEALQLVRPRTVLYAGLLSLVGCMMLVGWLRRTTLDVNVIADRTPPYVRLSDGSVRNTYTVKILNKAHEPHTFGVSVRDLPEAQLAILGGAAGQPETIMVATDELREFRVFVTVPGAALHPLPPPPFAFALVVRDQGAGNESVRRILFQAPAARAREGERN